MKIEAVIFDLGDTLINYGRLDVNVLLGEAARLSYEYLQKLGYKSDKLGSFKFYQLRHVPAIKLRYLWSNIVGREFDAQRLLDKQLRRKSIELSQQELDELSCLWFEPVARRARIEPDLHETLDRLQEMSLKLAIISNTFSPPVVLDRHLEHFDLIRYFSVRQYSSMMTFRKPDRRIFLPTLAALGVKPASAVMVGDKVRPDIRGARRLGMQAVFKRGSTNHQVKIDKGTAVIDSLSELPDLIRRWQGEG